MAQIDLGKVVGRSAYELAVANGFTGTEQEWLASLHGEKGDPGQDAENYQVLATKEEVQGNVESGKLVDALVIKEVFQSVSEGKGIIASAITDKGVQTDADASFAVLAENIGQISTGDGTGSGGGGHFDDPYPMQAYFSGYIASKSGQYRSVIRSVFTIKKAKKILIKSIKEKIAQAIFEAISPYVKKQNEETAIMGKSVATVEQLNALMLLQNPRSNGYLHLAKIFLEEGEREGVRGDGAFCQSLIETGYFRFGGDVHPTQHNYAGLGATGGVPGLSFPDDRTGIRAQIQHLKAYASVDPLVQGCVDPRYKYVRRGCAMTFEQLSGNWAVPGYSHYQSLEMARAAKDSYGDHIVRLLNRAISMAIAMSQ